MLARIVVDRRGLGAQAVLCIGERAVDERVELFVAEWFETEQRAAREQRTGEREERVLGGRADEDEEPFLDERQEDVLLARG